MTTMKIVKPLSIDSPEAREHIRQNRARELARLQTLEAIIEKGLKSFVEVGNAMMEIRDTGLYKKTHSTFGEYCRERWGMERAHAYRLIDGARVVKTLSPIGDTPISESHIRPLTKLSVMQQREVFKKATAKAASEKRKMTAKDVQGFVDRVTNPAKAWAPETQAASNVYHFSALQN